jgi:hypothetical protein
MEGETRHLVSQPPPHSIPFRGGGIPEINPFNSLYLYPPIHLRSKGRGPLPLFIYEVEEERCK